MCAAADNQRWTEIASQRFDGILRGAIQQDMHLRAEYYGLTYHPEVKLEDKAALAELIDRSKEDLLKGFRCRYDCDSVAAARRVWRSYLPLVMGRLQQDRQTHFRGDRGETWGEKGNVDGEIKHVCSPIGEPIVFTSFVFISF